jgi:hypothetical protein
MPTIKRKLTVGDLKKRLEGVANDTPIAQWGHSGGPYEVEEYSWERKDGSQSEFGEEMYLHEVTPNNSRTDFPIGTKVFIVASQDG